MKLHVLALIFLTLLSHGETITDKQGRSLEVDILNVTEHSVHVIRQSDQFKFEIPLDNLSESDQARLKTQTSTAPTPTFDFETLNQHLGIPLLVDVTLWDDAPEEIAKRLGWRLESKTSDQESYRKYYKSAKQKIANARPYCGALYAENGQVNYISIVFANKGDSIPQQLIDSDHKEALDYLKDAIKQDSKHLSSVLNQHAKPQKQTIGASKEMKERSRRWDIADHSFLVTSIEEEYLALRILPTHIADKKGRVDRSSTSKLKTKVKANVHTNDFQDVVIQNIPMVDQGPKGYCVPATLERCLRYMGIPADMYTLAMAGQTDLGGGTNVSAIIAGTQSFIKQTGRDLNKIKNDLSLKTVAKYIDDGQPILWRMSSSSEYNLFANTSTRQRKNAANIETWKDTLKANYKTHGPIYRDPNKSHICLIIGYNADTKELAVSDSWGPKYELRWVSIEAALDVSNHSLHYIDF